MIREFLKSVHPLSDLVLEEYLSCAAAVSFRRKEIITHQGQVEKYLYLVEEGIQRAYYLKEEKEHVVAFTYAPSLSGIPESFLTQTPSACFLECISPSRMLRISYQDHQRMLDKHRELEALARKLTEGVLIGFMRRHYELLSATIEERFLSFASRSPHLLNMVPHKHIASYLGIDPTNFSKLLNTHQI